MPLLLLSRVTTDALAFTPVIEAVCITSAAAVNEMLAMTLFAIIAIDFDVRLASSSLNFQIADICST